MAPTLRVNVLLMRAQAVSEVKELEETVAKCKEQLAASKKEKADAEKKIKQLEKEQASYADKVSWCWRCIHCCLSGCL